MQRKIITTGDGSKTIYIEEWNEQYHSTHGAIQEANYVFIKQGLKHYVDTNQVKDILILEIGFGTGLNGFITALEARKNKLHISYSGIEAYPVNNEEIDALNYVDLISPEDKGVFNKIHQVPWETSSEITQNFALTKHKKLFSEISDIDTFNLIYFDAFGARVQPELWTEAIFKAMLDALKSGGVLVTYSAKGSVRRAMQTVGFKVERLEGPPGKRHMLRATKQM